MVSDPESHNGRPADSLSPAADLAPRRPVDRAWLQQAMRSIDADYNRSADTHLIRIEVPRAEDITLYLKDESVHPTGSLKHRLARSLFLYALCNQWIGPDTVVIESSSGSTAVSEAYFARMLGLRFLAVVPESTASAKIAAIRFYGGEIYPVSDPTAVYSAARRLAQETGGHYLDQFTYAERATDWRGNNNIAESIGAQMREERHPIPTWVVCGAGTGGTSATIGRFIRYQKLDTLLCVADPENSVYHRHFTDRDVVSLPEGRGSCIEGIGRPRVEPSFIPEIIDRMIVVPDNQSIGAMRGISGVLGRRVGGSTGTNIWACAQIILEMIHRRQSGSIVTLLCDGGERYGDSYYSDDWLVERGIDWQGAALTVRRLFGGA